MLWFRRLLLFCIVSLFYISMSGFCSSASVLLSVSAFGFSVVVCLFLCLEASHTIYSLAPFLLPDRPIVSHWCTVGDVHTRGMLFLIHREQADTRHVENSIDSFFFLFFLEEEPNLSDKKNTSPCRALKAKGSQLHTYQDGADSSNKLMGSSAKHIDSTVPLSSAPD